LSEDDEFRSKLEKRLDELGLVPYRAIVAEGDSESPNNNPFTILLANTVFGDRVGILFPVKLDLKDDIPNVGAHDTVHQKVLLTQEDSEMEGAHTIANSAKAAFVQSNAGKNKPIIGAISFSFLGSYGVSARYCTAVVRDSGGGGPVFTLLERKSEDSDDSETYKTSVFKDSFDITDVPEFSHGVVPIIHADSLSTLKDTTLAIEDVRKISSTIEKSYIVENSDSLTSRVAHKTARLVKRIEMLKNRAEVAMYARDINTVKNASSTRQLFENGAYAARVEEAVGDATRDTISHLTKALEAVEKAIATVYVESRFVLPHDFNKSVVYAEYWGYPDEFNYANVAKSATTGGILVDEDGGDVTLINKNYSISRISSVISKAATKALVTKASSYQAESDSSSSGSGSFSGSESTDSEDEEEYEDDSSSVESD